MAKPQRKTINDALAEIAAQAPASTPDHAGRDHVATDDAPRSAPARIDIGRDPSPLAAIPMGRDHVATHHLSAGTDDDGYRVRVRREKPHISFYAHPRVFQAIRDLANAQRKKPHDLYVEGMRLMLAQYGLDFDELDGRPNRG
jgi:hypothetical protein